MIFPKVDKEIAAFFFVTFFMGMSVSLMAPLIPVIKEDFNLSYTLASFVLTSFGVARMLLALPSGYLYNHVNRKKLLLIGMGLMSVSSLIAGLSQSFAQFLIAQIIMGAGFSFCITTIIISLSVSTESGNRGKVLGMNTFARSAAAVVAPVMSGFIAITLGWRSVFLFYSFITFVAILFILFYIKKDYKKVREPVIRGNSKNNVRYMLFVLFLVSFLATFTTLGFKSTILPLYSRDVLHLEVAAISLVLSLMAVMHLITSPAAAILSDKYGRKSFLMFGLATTVIGTFLFLFVSNMPMLIVAAIFLGLGTMIFVLPVTIMGDITPHAKAGKYYGIQRFATDLGFVVGPISLGYIVDIYGFTAATLVTILISSVILILAAIFVHEPIKHEKINWRRILQMEED